MNEKKKRECLLLSNIPIFIIFLFQRHKILGSIRVKIIEYFLIFFCGNIIVINGITGMTILKVYI